MGKIFCFIYDDMADFEMTFVLNLLALQGKKEIVMIAHEKRVITSKAGIRYQPHLSVKEAIQTDDVDGLIIPGGWNDEQRPELTELIKTLHKQQKLLAAICRGPSYLARAGVLTGRKYTTTYTEQLVEELGVDDPFEREHFQDEPVVRDGHIITAHGDAFVDFGIEICDFFSLFKDPDEKQMVAGLYKGLK